MTNLPRTTQKMILTSKALVSQSAHAYSAKTKKFENACENATEVASFILVEVVKVDYDPHTKVYIYFDADDY